MQSITKCHGSTELPQWHCGNLIIHPVFLLAPAVSATRFRKQPEPHVSRGRDAPRRLLLAALIDFSLPAPLSASLASRCILQAQPSPGEDHTFRLPHRRSITPSRRLHHGPISKPVLETTPTCDKKSQTSSAMRSRKRLSCSTPTRTVISTIMN